MEERISDIYTDKGLSAFDQRLCQQQSSLMIPQMKLAAHNNSNPTLLVSGIPEQTSQHQENIGISNCNDTMDNQLFTSSLLPPQINHNRPWRSNSLTPPTPRNSEDCMVSQCDMISNFGVWNGGETPNYKLRSHSLTVLKNGQMRDEGHNDMAGPICSNCGANNMMQLAQILQGQNEIKQNQHNEENVDEMIRNLPFGSGMRGLKVYLKKLRLHKYCTTFLKYTYEEFLALTDDTLQKDGVTMGARGKILKSIEKIHRRHERLRELLLSIEGIENDPDMKNKLMTTLLELDEIILMPLKPRNETFYRSYPAIGCTANSDIDGTMANVPQMIYKLLEKTFIFTMLGHATDEVNQTLYGVLHNALKQECFNETQKSSIKSWIDKLSKVYENVMQPKSYDKRRSFRGDNGNAGRRVMPRSGSISSNHHVTHQTQNEPSFCQKRHSYAFQDDKMQIPPSTLALPTRLNSYDPFLPCINRARSSSGLYQASNNLVGSTGDSNSRRESSMSNDSGFMINDSRRTSEVDYFSSLGGMGCNQLVIPSSPTDWSHPLITLHTNYSHRTVQDQVPAQHDINSSSILDILTTQEPIGRRDSGMSTNSESSRRSSYFSASPVPPTLMYGCNNIHKKISNPVSTFGGNQANNMFGVCSTSSACSGSSTDSLLEQDLQNLAVSVSQKGLE